MLVTLAVVLVLLKVAAAQIDRSIDVVRILVPFGEERTLLVNNTVEFIIQFVPSAAQSVSPARVWARADAGVIARPLLLTARSYNGAQTWQLPYASPSGDRLFFELERTLCAPNGIDDEDDPCVDPADPAVRGEFSLHVSSSCVVPVTLAVRAEPLQPWILPMAQPLHLEASETEAAIVRYEFAQDQDSVRLVFEAEDDVCAILSVHDYECPIPETLAAVENSGLRMTVQRSGAVQLSRSTFKRGFVVVCTVLETDAPCVEDRIFDTEPETTTAAPPPVRVKHFQLEVRPALSRAQYAVAASATVLVFLVFYVGAGAVLFARRLPRCAPYLAPRAPLADVVSSSTAAGIDSEGGLAEPPTQRRRRRDSTATYDSYDDASDSDEEEERNAQPLEGTENANGAANGGGDARNGVAMTALSTEQAANGDSGGARPFGLPERLNVAVLSRRRAATLRARSDRYLTTLYTVAVFYALPVLQFVSAFQLVLNMWGSLDLCYFNFLCAHPAGAISDFNHVFSNVGYLLLGALFMLHVRRRRQYRRKFPKHEEYGIPAHYGLLSALGLGLMVVALLSATYHVCPNRLNFQFDTAFMYVLAVLSIVKMYQARHPDINARAHATFGVLALLIALVVWGVLGGGVWFWAVWTVLHVLAMLLLTLRIYYVGQFRFNKQSLAETRRGLTDARPMYGARLALLGAANLVNWGFAVYGLVTLPHDFPSHLLFILLSNTLLYMISYLIMKALHRECLRWYSWVILAGGAAAWAPALFYFTYGSTSWSDTPAASRHQNHECKVLEFYDAHDLWHMLSAVAMYLSFCALLTWDDGLSAVKRNEIPVF